MTGTPPCQFFSLLLTATTDALSLAAQSTNRSINLGKPATSRSSCHPEVRAAQQTCLAAARQLRELGSASHNHDALEQAKTAHSSARTELKRLTRAVTAQACADRDKKLHSILGGNPASIFRSLRALKTNTSTKIQKLTVGKKKHTLVVKFLTGSLIHCLL